MSKWIVVTEVESEIDPATWNYVNGTTLISSQLVEGECDKCAASYDLSSRDNRCGDCGNCDTCCTHEREGK
jgi:hypothetical protein